MTSNHENSFIWKDEYHYEEEGKYFKIKYGKRKSIKKRDFYRLKEKANGSLQRD
jgi:hypothetical protein